MQKPNPMQSFSLAASRLQRSSSTLVGQLRCRAHAPGAVPAARSERVLVLGDGPGMVSTVLELLTENDVTLLYTRGELQRLDNADRLLLLELVAEDELVLVDGDSIGKLATTSDGYCEVCLDGPEEGCSIYDQIVLCGDRISSCSASPQALSQRAG